MTAAAIRWLFDTDHVSLAIPVLPFDPACEAKFRELRALGVRVGSQDLRIAASAVVYELVLVTRNKQDFAQVPGLRFEDWSLA